MPDWVVSELLQNPCFRFIAKAKEGQGGQYDNCLNYSSVAQSRHNDSDKNHRHRLRCSLNQLKTSYTYY